MMMRSPLKMTVLLAGTLRSVHLLSQTNGEATWKQLPLTHVKNPSRAMQFSRRLQRISPPTDRNVLQL